MKYIKYYWDHVVIMNDNKYGKKWRRVWGNNGTKLLSRIRVVVNKVNQRIVDSEKS